MNGIHYGENIQNLLKIGNLWKELADFNKSTISNPTKLRKGTTIRLPSVNVLRGEATPVAVANVLPAPQMLTLTNPAQQQVQQQTQQPTITREYVVQKGDTLGSISTRELAHGNVRALSTR